MTVDREQLARELYRHHDIEMVPHPTDRWAGTGLYRCTGCQTTFTIEDGLPRWNVVARIRFRHLADIAIAYHRDHT